MDLPYSTHCKICGRQTKGYVFCGRCKHAFDRWLTNLDQKIRTYEQTSIFNFTLRKESHYGS